MSIRKTIALGGTLVLTALALSGPPAGAQTTRELLTSFGSIETPAGLAVDLETGNVYVADNRAQTVDVFGPTGGAPIGGVPAQITGVHINESLAWPSIVAIDNSCYEHTPRLTGTACEEYDPSYGDLYIGNEKFRLNPSHEYELVGEMYHGAPPPSGAAIDSHGNLYLTFHAYEGAYPRPAPVVELKKVVEKVINGGVEEIKERLEEISIPQHFVREATYVAVDDRGDLYVGSIDENGGVREGFRGVAKLQIDGAGGVVSEGALGQNQAGAKRPLAVNSATGAVYVGDNSEIKEYSQAGALQLAFGSTEPAGGSLGKEAEGTNAIAVNGETDLVYVINPLHHDVDVFGPTIGPPVIEGQQPAASSIARTSALIAGSADPESGHPANFYFEYVDGEEYDAAATEPYRAGGRTATGALAGGHAAEVTPGVALTGLRPGVTYHYRLVVINASGTSYGPDETFTTAAATPPVVTTGLAGEVTATSATLTGTVASLGLPTSYVFEVGADTGYGGAKLFGNAGASTGTASVSVGLQYLVPGTTYHFRLVATSFDGTSYGQDETFTTPGVPSPIGQPPSAALIASPSVQFPSVGGAITRPVGSVKPRKKSSSAQRLAAALRTCRRKPRGPQRASCEVRARRHRKPAATTNHSKKR
jgi:hypothetical protein